MELNRSPRRSRGFTLIEMLVALVIGMLAMGGIYQAFTTYTDSIANDTAAGHARKVRDAARNYIEDNRASLIAGAGPTTPVTITPAVLTAGGYLPTGFNPVNSYGQTFTVRVIEPTAGRLEAIVLTTGGDAISGINQRSIASKIGIDGGYVPAGVTAEGAQGAWSRDLTPFGGSPGAGRLAVALFVSDAATADDYLHRSSTPGRPELNRMSTAIDMGGNDLNGAGNINANKVNLPAGNSLQVGSTYYYGDGSNSAIRQSGGLYIQNYGGGAAPIAQVGNVASQGTVSGVNLSASSSVWSGGNVTASADLSGNRSFVNEAYAAGWFRTTGDTGWYSERWGGGWHMTDGTWIRAYGGKSVYTPGEMRANRMSTEGRVTTGEFLQIQGQSYRGWGCDTGSFAREPDGTGLFCKNGVFQAMGGGPTSGYYTYLGVFTSTYVGWNTSPYTSQVVVSAQAYSCGNNGYSVQLYSNGVWVGTVQDNNRTDAKVGHATFNVPAGGSFQITPQYTSYCYTQAHVWQYTQS